MTMLSKEGILFERDDAGELLGVEVILETLPDKPNVILKPMTRGEFLKYKTQATPEEMNDRDKNMIADKCINPKITLQEVEHLKPNIFVALSLAILSISIDIPQSQLLDALRKSQTGENIIDDILKKK